MILEKLSPAERAELKNIIYQTAISNMYYIITEDPNVENLTKAYYNNALRDYAIALCGLIDKAEVTANAEKG